MTGSARLRRLLVDAQAAPLAVSSRRPRFTWVVESDVAGATVTGARVVITAASVTSGGTEALADSGELGAGASGWTPPADLPLASGADAEWTVAVDVRAPDGGAATATATSTFGVGLLEADDWAGSGWVGADPGLEPATAAPRIRRRFSLPAPPVRARLHLAAGGFANAALNGRAVDDERLGPGVADWDMRVPVVTFDVAPLVAEGDNVLALELGRGFFGILTPNVWTWERAPFHAEPCVRALLVAELPDGSVVRVGTDAAAVVTRGPILSDSLYEGERFDARRDAEGWTDAGFDDTGWAPVALVAGPRGRLAPRAHPPIRAQRELAPTAVRRSASGEVVLDFGEVIAGWARVALPADPSSGADGGTELVLRFDERLDADGEVRPDHGVFGQGEFQTDRVRLGPIARDWEPRFSYQGFQHVAVAGWPGGEVPDGAVTAIHAHSEVPRTARFASSEPLLDWMHDAAVLTMQNNLHHIPTDTPVWEKNGWTGDAALGADMLIRDLDTAALLASWLLALEESVDDTGRPALIAPAPRTWNWEGAVVSPPWNGALLLVPWRIHLATGDVGVLARHWPAMVRYLRLEHATAVDGIAPNGLGDYLAPGTGGNPPEDLSVSGTAYLHELTRVAVAVAGVLGDRAAAAEFAALLPGVRAAFLREYYDADARVVRDAVAGYRQTHNVLALEFGLLPPGHEGDVAANLAADIDGRCGGHHDVGALGIRRLLQVLGDAGHLDTAWRVATAETYPSWGHWRANGATTMWEMWDDRRSRDHYFLGTVDDWLFSDVAGVRATEPGYRRVEIAPRFADRLGAASAELETTIGRVAVAWERDGGDARLDVTLPVGSSGVVALPGARPHPVASGRTALTIPIEGPR